MEETNIEEIECFIERAMIKTDEIHYIIAVHILCLNKQQEFCDFLNNCLKECGDKFSKAKLCFIDDSKSEKVYIHLCRPKMFNIEKKTSTIADIPKKTREKFIELLKYSFLITSQRPGLGKTYQAERKAR